MSGKPPAHAAREKEAVRNKRQRETMSTDTDPTDATEEQIEDYDTEDYDNWDVLHVNGTCWLATDPLGNTFAVNLRTGDPTVRPFGVGNEASNYGTKEIGAKNAAIRAVIRLGPNDRREPNVMRHAPAGNGGSSGSSGSSNDGDDPDEEPEERDTSVTGDHDYDEDAMIEAFKDWIKSYESVKDGLDADAVDVEFAQTDVPEGWDTDFAGQTIYGLRVETSAPWETGYHNGNDWSDQDGWQDHQEAFREIMQNEDAVIYFSDPDYFNFVPADSLGEVVGEDRL